MNRRALMVRRNAAVGARALRGRVLRSGESRVARARRRGAQDGDRASFVRLSDGVTHYQIDGPDTGRAIVLAHGFSVPLYIWDSTATALAAAGRRVIRYDAYGRGFSDRPNVEYSDKLYERQLGELLDSLKCEGQSGSRRRVGRWIRHRGVCGPASRSRAVVDSGGSRRRTITGVDASERSAGDRRISLADDARCRRWREGQASDFVEPSRFPDWADKYRVQMQYKGFGTCALVVAHVSARHEYGHHLSACGAANIPVLLIWGMEDHTVPFANNALVRKAIPSAEFHRVRARICRFSKRRGRIRWCSRSSRDEAAVIRDGPLSSRRNVGLSGAVR